MEKNIRISHSHDYLESVESVEEHSKLYTFSTNIPNLKFNDYVLVETRFGVRVGVVVDYIEDEEIHSSVIGELNINKYNIEPWSEYSASDVIKIGDCEDFVLAKKLNLHGVSLIHVINYMLANNKKTMLLAENLIGDYIHVEDAEYKCSITLDTNMIELEDSSSNYFADEDIYDEAYEDYILNEEFLNLGYKNNGKYLKISARMLLPEHSEEVEKIRFVNFYDLDNFKFSKNKFTVEKSKMFKETFYNILDDLIEYECLELEAKTLKIAFNRTLEVFELSKDKYATSIYYNKDKEDYVLSLLEKNNDKYEKVLSFDYKEKGE